MSVRILHCPNCGDLWKRIRFERFVLLGPPWRQCRACLAWHDSEHKEWFQLKASQRIGFLAQNIVLILPLALLYILGASYSHFLGNVSTADLLDYSVMAGFILLGLLTLLLIWAGCRVVLSLLRTRRHVGQAQPMPSTGGKFISDAAWQASRAGRTRLPAPQPAPITAEPEQEVSQEGRIPHPA